MSDEVAFLAVRRAIDKWPEATLVERVGLAIAETYQFPKGREGPSRSPLTDHTVIQLAKAALLALEGAESEYVAWCSQHHLYFQEGFNQNAPA